MQAEFMACDFIFQYIADLQLNLHISTHFYEFISRSLYDVIDPMSYS